jgi:ABC-type uncharacterized transport system fused permease/ATPase subunit
MIDALLTALVLALIVLAISVDLAAAIGWLRRTFTRRLIG